MTFDHFGGTSVQAAVSEVAFAGGTILDGLALGAVVKRVRRGVLALLSIGVMGVSSAIAGLCRPEQFWLFALVCVVMGIVGPWWNGPVTALTQERIPASLLGRAFGLLSALTSLAVPVGLAISGTFADVIGTAHFFLVDGVLMLALTVVAVLVPSVRHCDRPEPPALAPAAR